MKLIVGTRYLVSDRNGKPTCFFILKHIKDARLWYKMLREGIATIVPA
jgi:hypothetical protein